MQISITTTLKRKENIVSIVIGKEFDKIQHSFMTETTSKLGIEENFFNQGKGYQKPASVVILNDVDNIPFKIRIQ